MWRSTLSTVLLAVLSASYAEEYPTPASFLGPKVFNHHAYETQYLREVEATKQGPVLFPTAGPSPRTPLIVTSRPLIESIARSDLNQPNNTLAESAQSQISRVTFVPNYFGGAGFAGKQILPYRTVHLNKPRLYTSISTVSPLDYLKKIQAYNVNRGNNYDVNEINDYNVNGINDYEIDDNTVSEDKDHSENNNYAFSYKVKDHATGDDFSHSQHSTGSATNGEYTVRLPDGRKQIVSYVADENGYRADVRYDDDDRNNGVDTGNNIYDQNDVFDGNRKVYNNYNIGYKKEFNVPNNEAGYKQYNDEFDGNRKVYNDHNIEYKKELNEPNYNTNEYKKQYDVKEYNEGQDLEQDYNQFYDGSKEYFANDYSQENVAYDAHRSKYVSFAPKDKLGVIVIPNDVKVTTNKPYYNDVKPIFVRRNSVKVPNLANVQINVPSTTPSSLADGTTEHVVLIGGHKPYVYTDSKSSVSPIINNIEPKNYLVTTIDNLKKRIAAKPIMSEEFIKRVNAYLSS